MYKIQLTESILKRHLDYFNEEVAKKMDPSSYNILLGKCLSKKEINIQIEEFQKTREYKAFADFMDYCADKKDIIAIGNMKDLQSLKSDLSRRMGLFKSCDVLMRVLKRIFDYDAFAKSKATVNELLQAPSDVFDRAWCAYTFVIMLGLRVCPYCNEQYIAPTLSKDGRVRGDLDHFLPKEQYPFFSLSIYNLIPCCKFCNSSLKGTKLFKKSSTSTPYDISYDDCFKFEVKYDGKKWNVGIKMNVREGGKFEEISKAFLIRERYQHHTDVVTEYIEKKKFYCEFLIENISRKYGCEAVDSFLSFYYGYPMNANEINDNVLNKFKRDLAKVF